MSTEELRIQVPGPVAQDKDAAREIRTRKILPSLGDGRRLILDFSGVTTATQSFLHACLSEAIQQYGEEVLEQIEFQACSEDIKYLIATVVEYSLRARTLTQEGLSGSLRKADVPQADNLDFVRDVLDAVAAGFSTPQDIEHATAFSFRHVQYRLYAARVLGLIKLGRNLASLTPRGRKLTSTVRKSESERQQFIGAIQESPVLKKLCPTLLERKGPTLKELARRLQQKTGLRSSTASRRAKALLAWRRALLDVQVRLPGM